MSSLHSAATPRLPYTTVGTHDGGVRDVAERGFVSGELLGGLKQSVAIARALANEPRILIMDEPFGALDAQTRCQMQSYLLQIWRKVDITILFITHDLEEAAYLSDRILVMGTNPGRVVEFIENPIPRPRSPAQFVSPKHLTMKLRLEGDKLPVIKLISADDDVK